MSDEYVFEDIAVGDLAFMTRYDAHVEAWWARRRARRRWGVSCTGCLVLEHGLHELPEGVWRVTSYGFLTVTRDYTGPCEVVVGAELAVAIPRPCPEQQFHFDVMVQRGRVIPKHRHGPSEGTL